MTQPSSPSPPPEADDDFTTLYTTVAALVERERRGPSRSEAERVGVLHVVNPVAAKPGSDLAVAQPITFAAMAAAKAWAEGRDPQLTVRLAATGYPEDAAVVPAGFELLPDLQRSAIDLQAFQKPRKLPVLWDILERGRAAAAAAAPAADTLIYTNADIAPMPHFYGFAAGLIRKGYDAVIINRRTIPAIHTDPAGLPFMYSELGRSHPGLDCFVFRRALMDRFVPSRACIGAGFVMRSLLFNLVATAGRMAILVDAHATFHVGDDRIWADPVYADYEAFNKNEALGVLNAFCRDPHLHRRFVAFARQAGENWLPEPFYPAPSRPSPVRRLLKRVVGSGRSLVRRRSGGDA